MRNRSHNWLHQVQSFAGRKWYTAFISFLAAIDSFVLVIPTEALLVPAILSQPRYWKRTTFFVTLGSVVGATVLAALAGYYGDGFIQSIFPHLLQSPEWNNAVRWIHDYGALGVVVISFGPFPQYIGVAIAGLAHLPLAKVIAAVFLGRTLKYGLLAWCLTHSSRIPGVLRLLKFGRRR